MAKRSSILLHAAQTVSGAAVLLGLYLASLYSYLLFHTLVEIFSIVVACGIFMIAWNARRFLDNNYLLFVGISFLFVSFLDLFHAFAYKGMGVFHGYDTNLPTQLWIAARSLGSTSFLIAPLLFGRRLKPHLVFAAYTAVTAFVLGSIFFWKTFPDCYIEDAGLTRFKIYSEYVISLIFAVSLVLLLRKREEFDRGVLRLLTAAIILTMGSELAFTFYVGVYDLSNLVGHFFKVISFYLIYKALIETGLVKPYDLLFRNLKKSEESLREERDRTQNYLDVAKAILVVIGADERVSLINKKGGEILGRPESEVVGKNWFDHFVPGAIREEVRGAFNKLIAGDIAPVEYFENPVLAKNGEERIIAWHNAVLTDANGNITATLSSGEDITERKRTEENLARKTAELERSNEELNRFASVVSHDLREPLFTIGGFAEMLKERYGDKLDPKAKGFISNIIKGTVRMELLINDLLAYARLSSSESPLKPVHCATVIGVVLSNLSAAIEENNAVITFDKLPVVTGDETQFIQLFQNLIANAIKYRSDQPPRIHVSAKPIAACGAGNAECEIKSAIRIPQSEMKTGWLFSVADNGIGIDPVHFEQIFQLFHRLHRGEKHSGTGIGLAVCKKIVERRGGRIWVESEPGRGSTFHFTIP